MPEITINMLEFFYAVTAILYVVLLAAIFRKDRSSEITWSFVLFLSGLLLWHVTLYLYLFRYFGDTSLLFIGRLNYATGSVFTAGLLAFFYYFPQRTFQLSKILKWIFLLLPILTFCLTLFTPLVDANEVMTPAGPAVTLGKWYWFYLTQVCGFPLLTIFLGIRKSFALQGIDRARFRYVFIIFVPTILAFFFSNLVLPIFGFIEQFQYSFLFIVPIALACFYAMHRYRFFNFSNASLNFFRNFLIITASVLAVILGYQFFEIFLKLNYIFANILSFIFAIALFTYLQSNFPELVTADFREFRDVLLRLRTALPASPTYKDMQSLLEQAFQIELNIPTVQVFAIRTAPENIELPIYIQDKFTFELSKIKYILISEELEISSQGEKKVQKILFEGMRKLHADICLPLFADQKIIGFFLLSKKTKAASYSREEIQEIGKLQHALEISLLNILLQANLREEKDLLKKIVSEKTQDLQKLIQHQTDFMAVAAHELRTPLSIALFKLQEILGEKEEYKILKKLFQELQIVEISLLNLKKLTQQLFEVEQYELGKIELHFQEVHIQGFMDQVFHEFEPLMVEKSLQFKFLNTLKADRLIALDPEKIRQVLNNLLTNAIKFTSARGEITLHLNQESDFIKICVADSGPGIPDDEKERLFEKFQTLHASMGMGIGLGLYLSKNIVLLHKGQIWLEDAIPHGAKFCISLPAATRKKLPSKNKRKQ